MGHSDLRTTMEYEHLVDDDLIQLFAPPPGRRQAADR